MTTQLLLREKGFASRSTWASRAERKVCRGCFSYMKAQPTGADDATTRALLREEQDLDASSVLRAETTEPRSVSLERPCQRMCLLYAPSKQAPLVTHGRRYFACPQQFRAVCYEFWREKQSEEVSETAERTNRNTFVKAVLGAYHSVVKSVERLSITATSTSTSYT